ncbi:MAG: xylulokinase [Bifidobacteriaceae bacterium]|jgi:xylulokinase|nr:xylulokinase [Bifidobacteriaceae bacterium]
MAVVAGVDSSTQSCKVELRESATGQLLGSGQAPHPPTTPPVSEQDPAAWWQALKVAFAEACDRADTPPGAVRAIAIAAQCHGLVLQGADGQVLRPAKLWNDLTSAPQAKAMVRDTGSAFWAQAVGSVPTAAFTITKLAWMAEHEPAILAEAARACLPHDYLTWKLTGRSVTDRSEASGTGYYASHEGRYRTDLLQEFGGAGGLALPEVLGPAEFAGYASGAAAELGLPADAVVGPGAGDQHAGALGIGIGPGDLLFSLGTSGVTMTVTDHSVHDPTGWVDGVSDATGRYLPLVCTLNATKVTDWFRSILGVSFAEFDELALSVAPSERTLTLAAFFDGERTPDLPRAVGILGGLTTASTRAQLARAAVDGVAMGLLEGVDGIVRCGADVGGRVVVTGGGAHSAAYRQSLADFLGRPVVVADTGDAAARGACLQAAAVLAGACVDHVKEQWRPAELAVTEPGDQVPSQVRRLYRELASYRQVDR